MTANQVALWYLVASICFILALKGLSHPSTARRGNMLGIAGMAIAVVVTLALVYSHTRNVGMILAGIAVGGVVGAIIARRVQMTQMPELVAAFHSLVGLAAVLIAISAIHDPAAFGLHVPIPSGNRLELFIGTFIGAITFSGSVIAFGKLSGRIRSAPVVFAGQHMLNLALAVAMIAFGVWFFMSPDESKWLPYIVMTAIAFVLGVLIIIPIGGADMPVVISMLNSYSGWAAAGIGFSLNNPMLIIAGSLVGSSGAILSYIMCKAMNRSFFNVILGGFGAEPGAAVAGGEQKSVRSGSADDAAFIMSNAESVVIVPGYGLAVARAQHAVKEMAEKLRAKGVNVRYAIHPVAGRMPGHMNVLLAEAEVPYDQVFEMEDINSEFGSTDVALILGANDVVNPLAEQKGSPIYGMPILEAHKARTVIVNKRSMAAGYAGLDNPLFYMDKTMMVFGDAKKVVEDIVKAID
ncbi:MAG: NAD(P)(+) transhydrogenase (Re/Si-specific) subunit beta [Betaproteobacteria bacterium]|nr:NAD(P)(+) transhydrogenase (Re/Si-specific) subunit beta [Betaproteobacteria bacterium]MDE2002391.1 NAD(P)(+) transhydrogenase (Re/Si-specific) subunit beta [Betaproteobacteria bacterium]